MGVPGVGSQSKLWMVETLPFDASAAQCFEFQSESLRATSGKVYNDGIRGTRARARERCRDGVIVCNGSISMTPSKTELDTLLPWILGTNATGSGTFGSPYSYTLAETLQEFQVLVYRVSSAATHTRQVFLYEGCRVARATFSASAGGPLSLTLEIEAETETSYQNGSGANWDAYDGSTNVLTADGNSIPTTSPDNESMFMFYDTTNPGSTGVFEVAGVVREAFDWSLTIDNMLDTGRHLNSRVRSNIPAMDRQVGIACTLPFTSDEDDLYNLAVNATSPDMNDWLFTFYNPNGTGTTDHAMQFTLGTVNLDETTPTVNSKGEIVLSLSGVSYRKNSSTAKAELACATWAV